MQGQLKCLYILNARTWHIHLALAFIQGIILQSISFVLSPYQSVQTQAPCQVNSTDPLGLNWAEMSEYEDDSERTNGIGFRENETHI